MLPMQQIELIGIYNWIEATKSGEPCRVHNSESWLRRLQPFSIETLCILYFIYTPSLDRRRLLSGTTTFVGFFLLSFYLCTASSFPASSISVCSIFSVYAVEAEYQLLSLLCSERSVKGIAIDYVVIGATLGMKINPHPMLD